jgi:type IV pilus assembly protein PilP
MSCAADTKRLRAGLCLFCAAALLAGCAQNDMSDLQNRLSEIKGRKPNPIEPLPQLKAVESFVYLPAGRRDPFRPAGQLQEEDATVPSNNGIAPDPTRRKEELEYYPLDAIKMVGTLEHNGQMWGLVSAPESGLHRVLAGNYMGRNHGQIAQISESKIELMEIVSDGRGGYEERRAEIALSE